MSLPIFGINPALVIDGRHPSATLWDSHTDIAVQFSLGGDSSVRYQLLE